MCAATAARPRHADLFATDLDEQTLIRYIDRLLMFYVAHRGQAATHLGLDGEHGRARHLRSVIIEDRLGIGAELEAMMEDSRHLAVRVEEHIGGSGQAPKLFEAFVNRPEGRGTPPRREEQGQWAPDIAVKGGGMSGGQRVCTPAISIKEVV